jgi:hypothetical protein
MDTRAALIDSPKIPADRKIIRISSKRQITIPQTYYDQLEFKGDAICYIDGDSMIIRPIENAGGSFAEFILADLIAEGLEGEALLSEFIRRQGQVRPAVEQLIAEADSLANNPKNHTTTAELFGK